MLPNTREDKRETKSDWISRKYLYLITVSERGLPNTIKIQQGYGKMLQRKSTTAEQAKPTEQSSSQWEHVLWSPKPTSLCLKQGNQDPHAGSREQPGFTDWSGEQDLGEVAEENRQYSCIPVAADFCWLGRNKGSWAQPQLCVISDLAWDSGRIIARQKQHPGPSAFVI